MHYLKKKVLILNLSYYLAHVLFKHNERLDFCFQMIKFLRYYFCGTPSREVLLWRILFNKFLSYSFHINSWTCKIFFQFFWWIIHFNWCMTSDFIVITPGPGLKIVIYIIIIYIIIWTNSIFQNILCSTGGGGDINGLYVSIYIL